ncbi:5'/3'-nucleotidase SurE [Acholeplasma sp. OttesenSCG-928-E16]|nr:5'/3'-nucleotidase SurE [Acholeplasma sp. OttesenSCG-928-E16]
MNILVVNDDGIESDGLKILVKALSYQGRIFVCAPKTQQSATSHRISIGNAIYVDEISDFTGSSGTLVVDGSPADCVRLGMKIFNHVDFDLVVSGINQGANLSIDTHYSGTVAAAKEAKILGIPAIAISAPDVTAPFIYDETVRLLDEIIENELYDFDGILNVNYPKNKPRGRVITSLGSRQYHAEFVRSSSDFNKYHILYSILDISGDDNTDSFAYDHDYVSITPLSIDTTNQKAMKKLRTFFNGEIK